MKNEIDELNYTESGGGVWGILLIAIALSLFVAVAFSGGDPAYTPPPTTGAGRQQAIRPAQASRPSGDATAAAPAPTWTPQPTYTPLPTYTAVPSPVPSQTPLPTYTLPATQTALPTYTAVPPTQTRPPLMAIVPIATPAPSGSNGDSWLIAGMVLSAVAFLVCLVIMAFFAFHGRRPIVVVSPPRPAPQRAILPPPVGQPKRELAPVPPVPSTSATSANTPVAPVLPGQGGKMSLTVTPDQNDFNHAEVARLVALYWQLPEGKRTQNSLIAAMWGVNEKGEPKKGSGRNAVVQYVIKLCKEQDRQDRLDEMTIHSRDRTIPLNQRIIRNQPPRPQRRPFPLPVKGVEG